MIFRTQKPKWALNRRHFLRGIGGVAIGLPFLDVMRPVAAQEEQSPLRIVYYYTPQGVIEEDWFPFGDETNFTLSNPLSPLQSYKDKLLVFKGLSNEASNIQDGGAHFRGTASFLTCTRVEQDSISNGVSADQHIANHLTGETLYSSLEFGVHSADLTGQCGSGWPCSYVRSISWGNNHTARAFLKPSKMFQRLFVDENVDAASLQDMIRRRGKILDVVLAQAQRLEANVGAQDRQKLDQYFTSISEVEQRLQHFLWMQCETPDIDFSTEYLAVLDQMSDLMVIALQCDYSRVLSAMTHSGGASHGINYNWIDDASGNPLQDSFHSYSHHGDNTQKKAAVTAINQWEMEVFASFLHKLQAIPEGNGSLLDNTLIHFGKEYGNASNHTSDNMPIVLVAGANCGLQSGRFIEAQESYANLLISEMQLMGLSANTFGEDGDGPLSVL